MSSTTPTAAAMKEDEQESFVVVRRNKKKGKAADEQAPPRLAGLPFSTFSQALRDQFSTLQEPPVRAKSSSPTPPATQTDVIVERYKNLEKLLREARESGDLSRLFRNKLVVDPTLHKESEPSDGDRVAYSLRLATKQQIWDRMSSDLLTQEEIMEFYGILEKWADKTPKPLNTKWFRWVERGLRDRGVLVYEKEWLTTTKFMSLMSESDDKIFRRLPIIHLFNYVMKRVWLIQTRLGFINYDLDCQGYLTEEWMESYIRELLPTLQQLEGMESALEPFYLCAASRKFFFFLDPRHIGKVQIVAIMSSMLLDEILEVSCS
ncbi:Serine/threonine-protein phosphatase 2A regulatory subunit B'' subunit gamma [Folsomia candida]|uniref:Serine/threonine-protein phosphatase 2A regulatory subunit B'' subunit gamma n=1 Tax=Folsomia candida TaxID=158441 RepID=A0A226D2P0_FOLCA|nr:Serine/threonine-protein phosphatase 2A regulatory subunit B'' subunit gamma [Folsomia candida]